jgi:hypothetical protein
MKCGILSTNSVLPLATLTSLSFPSSLKSITSLSLFLIIPFSFLWPLFDPTSASLTHIFCIILMTNEKVRNGITPWSSFTATNKATFSGFFSRVIEVTTKISQEEKNRISFFEKTQYIMFLDACFTSFETDLVCKECFKYYLLILLFLNVFL